MNLPDAVVQYPLCGACGGETYHDGDNLRCEDCKLIFDPDTLEARREDGLACDAPCDNDWHTNKGRPARYRWTCHPCQLTEGHESMHWTGCERRWVGES